MTTTKMSSVIPILSSSPPPLNDSIQDAVEDALGDFEVASNDISLDKHLNNSIDVNSSHCLSESVSCHNSSAVYSICDNQTNGNIPHSIHNQINDRCSLSSDSDTANNVLNLQDLPTATNNQNNIEQQHPVLEVPNPNCADEPPDVSLQQSTDSVAEDFGDLKNSTFASTEANGVQDLHLGSLNGSSAPENNQFCNGAGQSECDNVAPQADEFADFSIDIIDTPRNDVGNSEMKSTQCQDFSDFSATSQVEDLKLDKTTDDDDFGDFSTTEQVDDLKLDQVTVSDDFGNFSTSQTDDLKLVKSANGDFGDFCATEQAEDLKLEQSTVDDDFGDFSTTSQTDDLKLEKATIDDDLSANCNVVDNDFGDFETRTDDDDFGDFETRTGDDDFGDFETRTGDDDDWAADFKCCDHEDESKSEGSRAKNATSIIIAAILDGEASTLQDGTECELNLLVDCEILKQLQVIEHSKSLNIQWTCLKTNHCLLKALQIDSRNILFGQNRNASIPIFASNLGLLEPTKPTEPKKCELSDIDGKSTSTTCSQPSSPSLTENIPPVQFDWSVSGLTNPLEGSSILLDVDMFASSQLITSPVSKSSGLEDEFLSSPSPEQLGPSSTSVLDKLMSSAKQTTYIAHDSTKKNRPDGLSEEANEILDKLVSLSFMNAKVLMFPISHSNAA